MWFAPIFDPSAIPALDGIRIRAVDFRRRGLTVRELPLLERVNSRPKSRKCGGETPELG